MIKIQKPKPGEYAPYAVIYVDLIPEDSDIIEVLEGSLQTVRNLVGSIPVEKLDIPCAEGEWTVKEVLSHNMDTERVFTYRALRFARNDPAELFPVDQDLYVKYSGINARSIESILEEYASIRKATLTLFKSFDEAAIKRAGKVSGNPTTVEALMWLTAGHEAHHLNSIRQNYL
jgi:uncharacterized damage-inducible protein DinB